jgi:AraC family transcriptional activator FtrA
MPFIVKNMPTRRMLKRSLRLPHKIAVLAYDRMSTFEFGIVVELFGLPRPELDSWYTFEVCALESGPLRTTGGVRILADSGLRSLLSADTIIVAGWRDSNEPPPTRLIRTLISAHRRGARLVSICTGIYVLAATGLLDGRRATAHWRDTPVLAKTFPNIEILPDVLYVDEGDVLTSAGSAAGIDLCLHIIRKDFGTSIANLVARRLVVAPHRDGGQAQFIKRPVEEPENPWLSRLLEWAQRRLHNRVTVNDLAVQARMSKRTLSRRFAEATGEGPLEWLNGLRIRLAKDLLETTALSVEEIAEKCGFGSSPTLRHHFRTNVKLSPNRYRDSFQQEL